MYYGARCFIKRRSCWTMPVGSQFVGWCIQPPRFRFGCDTGSGMPIQVVDPSVSRANRPQGTALMLAVDVTSLPALSAPALRKPAGGAAVTPAADGAGAAGGAGTASGGGTTGGGSASGGGDTAGPGPVAVPGVCCAKPVDDVTNRIAMIEKAEIRIETSYDNSGFITPWMGQRMLAGLRAT
jgi:hypothetical protein